MKKSLLLSAFTLCLSAAFAQYDLTITYNSNSGVSNLQTATKLYMHSGGNDMAGPLDTTCWNYTVGNWGVDDGIGELILFHTIVLHQTDRLQVRKFKEWL